LKKNFTDETEEYKKEKDFLKKVVALEQQRLKNLSEISELTAFFFKKIPEYDTQLLVWKKITLEEAGNNLERLYELLSSIKNTEWNQENIESKTVGFIKDNNLGVGDFLWPMRVALTGKQHSPGPFETSEVLGREESLKRIEYAINKIKKG
jgi:glutamyl-tRNA synthetase